MGDDKDYEGKDRGSLEGVGPSFENVIRYATTESGEIDLRKIDALEGRFAEYHGNRRCDVLEGPCACGAWH